MIYKSLSEYAREKKINWKTAKKRLTKGLLVKVDTGKGKIIIDTKKMLKFLIDKLE